MSEMGQQTAQLKKVYCILQKPLYFVLKIQPFGV